MTESVNGLVIVDKPAGMTSHDVVDRVRRLAGTRRVGHAGTLDPMATGVLVVGAGQATRLLGYLTLTEKEYVTTIRLGQSTPTDDAEGEPLGGASAAGVSPEALKAAVAGLTGEIQQVPPRVSAIKVGGQRAYKLTRAGAAPELAARPVTVHEFAVTGTRRHGDLLDVDATVRCSSGTYVRALARDLGTALGTGGHLTHLRRTRVGAYDIAQARTLDELTERMVVTPLAAAAAAAFPRRDLTPDEARRLANGARIPATSPQVGPQTPSDPYPAPTPSTPRTSPTPRTPQTPHTPETPGTSQTPGTPVAAFAPDGTLIALITEDGGQARPLAVFAAPTP